ncbi:MAG TPA: hypothetical protein VK892_05840 [Pyrinomonadaceae bacterium]|nr:hypothetical protein [Pyrinomonadaceae bacterium]
MKICPKCQKTYADESLNFCLDDGTVLTSTTVNTIPETVFINQPRPTSPNQTPGTPLQQNWGGITPVATGKSSNTGLWILGILAVLVLICGGGFVAFIAFIANIEKDPQQNSNSGTNIVNSSPPDDRKSVQKIDLPSWAKADYSQYGKLEAKNGEVLMSSNRDGYYFVLVARKEYVTNNATTKLSVRNVNNSPTTLGYGLIVHSNPKPLQQDYAFLIDSQEQKYRIVSHSPNKENTVKNWTSSTAIKTGAQENVLEVRDENNMMNFYINGQLVDSLKNSEGYKNGVPGIYTGGLAPIGFSNFEVRK